VAATRGGHSKSRMWGNVEGMFSVGAQFIAPGNVVPFLWTALSAYSLSR